VVICPEDAWTFSANRLNYLNFGCSISSPLFLFFFLFAPSHRLLGEPDSTGSVSGRVSRCSAETSAPCAAAQWAGKGNGIFIITMEIVFDYPSYTVVLLLCIDVPCLSFSSFLLEPPRVASQIWGGSSWKLSCTIHPCIRGLWGKSSGSVKVNVFPQTEDILSNFPLNRDRLRSWRKRRKHKRSYRKTARRTRRCWQRR